MQQFILRENVVSDNILEIPTKGYVFKGGYIAIIKENVFQNAWQDKETVKKFRSKDKLMKYLNKNYSEEVVFDLDFIDTCLE